MKNYKTLLSLLGLLILSFGIAVGDISFPLGALCAVIGGWLMGRYL